MNIWKKPEASDVIMLWWGVNPMTSIEGYNYTVIGNAPIDKYKILGIVSGDYEADFDFREYLKVNSVSISDKPHSVSITIYEIEHRKNGELISEFKHHDPKECLKFIMNSQDAWLHNPLGEMPSIEADRYRTAFGSLQIEVFNRHIDEWQLAQSKVKEKFVVILKEE